MNVGFVERLRAAFNDESMADVARRLKIPHATVRNYYSGRLPAAEVLIKIANETGVSLNWLLIGSGEKYSGNAKPLELGNFLEEKIGQMIDRKLLTQGHRSAPYRGNVDLPSDFDVEEAVVRLNEPEAVMREWFNYENRLYPRDFGVVFFRGWETFTPKERVEAVLDAKRVVDRSLETAIRRD